MLRRYKIQRDKVRCQINRFNKKDNKYIAPLIPAFLVEKLIALKKFDRIVPDPITETILLSEVKESYGFIFLDAYEAAIRFDQIEKEFEALRGFCAGHSVLIDAKLKELIYEIPQ